MYRKSATHSHAEAALAAGGDLHVAHYVGVVESLVEWRGAGLGGEGHLVGDGDGLLTGGGGLEEAGGGAGEGKEEDREEGTCHC